MNELAPGWLAQVERGPDWLFVRLERPGLEAEDSPPLAEALWELLERHFVHRLVVEMDQVEYLQSAMIGQLVLLHKRLYNAGGILRLCGLSASNQEVLHSLRLDGRFPHYADREEAVMGYRPTQPR